MCFVHTRRLCCHNTDALPKHSSPQTWRMNNELNNFVDVSIRLRSEPRENWPLRFPGIPAKDNQYILTWLRPWQAFTEPSREGLRVQYSIEMCNAMASAQRETVMCQTGGKVSSDLYNMTNRVSPWYCEISSKNHTCHIYFSLPFKLVETVGGWSLEIFITKAPRTCWDSLWTLNPIFLSKMQPYSHNTTDWALRRRSCEKSFGLNIFPFQRAQAEPKEAMKWNYICDTAWWGRDQACL